MSDRSILITFCCGYENCCILGQEDILLKNICACFPWEIAICIGLDVPLDDL